MCQALEKNTTLQSLDLSCECSAVQRVILVVSHLFADSSASSGNHIGEAGAAAMCQALEKNTTLQSLDLSGECSAVQRVMYVVFSFVR
jgi:hypothetical protein